MTFQTKPSLKKLDKSLPVLLGILVYSSAFYFFSFITADTDLWGHIKFGKDLWASKALSRFDIYSYTAYGMEWINHEWLAELLMFFIYRITGSPGLLTVKLLTGFAIVYFLSRMCHYRICHPIICAAVFVLSIFIMSPGFMARPQIFTFLFTTIFLFIIHLYLEKERNLLWCLPVIMVVWVNSHGGFLIGAGMLPVVVVCELASVYMKNNDSNYIRSLILWTILTEVSVLLNPYGYHLIIFLYETLGLPRSIDEWSSIGIFDLTYLRFKLLAFLVILALFIERSWHRYWEIGIIGVAMFYAFSHERHTPVFAIVATCFVTEKLSILGSRIDIDNRIKSYPSHLILSLCVLVFIGYQTYHSVDKHIKAKLNILVRPDIFPVSAVNFIKENRITGNVLLPFEWGEYAIWKLHPDCKVSVDGRFRTVYPEEVLEDHLSGLYDESRFMEILNKYPTDIVLVRRNYISQSLISRSKEWIYAYSDPISIVFIKDDDLHKDVITKLKKKELKYPKGVPSIFFP